MRQQTNIDLQQQYIDFDNQLKKTFIYTIKSATKDGHGDLHTPNFLIDLVKVFKKNTPVRFLHTEEDVKVLTKLFGYFIPQDYIARYGEQIGKIISLEPAKDKNGIPVVNAEVEFDNSNDIVKWLEDNGLLNKFGISTEILTASIIKINDNIANGIKNGGLLAVALVPNPTDKFSQLVQYKSQNMAEQEIQQKAIGDDVMLTAEIENAQQETATALEVAEEQAEEQVVISPITDTMSSLVCDLKDKQEILDKIQSILALITQGNIAVAERIVMKLLSCEICQDEDLSDLALKAIKTFVDAKDVAGSTTDVIDNQEPITTLNVSPDISQELENPTEMSSCTPKIQKKSKIYKLKLKKTLTNN